VRPIGRALAIADGAQLDAYRRLVAALAVEPIDQLVLDGLAGELARAAERGGIAGSVSLIQELLGRTVAAALERLGPELFAGEGATLQALAARRPLDRWAGLWEKVARLAAATEGLNLERSHAFMRILTLLAPAAERAEGGDDGGAFGAYHVPG
jgi:hypothetical protein